MNVRVCIVIIACTQALLLTACSGAAQPAPTVELITLDPGHFHAALVQKFMYPQVSPVVHVYAPGGSDLQEHLARITAFNSRKDDPTHWDEKVYTEYDFLARMIQERRGNVVVLSGNNARKIDYISQSIDAGFNVLADKPMAIDPAGFEKLRQAFDRAAEKKVLLYDIMTERHEICTALQRELSQMPEVFGRLQEGTAAEPAVTKESVHHFSKLVAGKPLTRPAWFFDVSQQGEGIVDVTTHLVDLIQWECFPDQALDWRKDVQIQAARHWATKLSPEQFATVTGEKTYPDFLKKDIGADQQLSVYSNGQFDYTLRGVHARVSVTWNFQPPTGAGDTHYSMMRGTRANLVIRQGQPQGFKPMLYVENKSGEPDAAFEATLNGVVAKLNGKYPGLSVAKLPDGWQIVIPDRYSVGHEAHFAQVTAKYLKYLQEGKLPDWEVPNMIAKYYTTTKAYEMSR